MTQRRIFLVPLLGRSSVEQEVDHWEDHHAPLFAQTPGLLGYVQYRALAEEWERGFRHVCSETTFSSQDAERAAYDSDFYRERVTPDEASFLDRDAAWSARVLADEEPGDRLAADPTYTVVQLGGARPGESWQSLQVSREAPGGGSQLHLLCTTDRVEALALSRLASVASFACRRIPVHVRSETR